MNLKINNLWMDRIPNNIYINNLYKKYNYSKVNYNINPIIGEYDDPLNQVQGLLTLNLTTNGNTMIYGIADSGKDELLQTLVFSCLSMYGTNELNMYIVDFGAETLINFENAPQVGNVILNGEDEKLENLIKMLGSELLKRKKLFTSYNGNYLDYLKLSGRGLCNIIVVINSIEVMSEVYPDLIDRLTPIIREGSKYGITFVMTSVSQSSAKFKIVQSCKQFICLQMANETDYRDILGKTDGLVPSNNLGRGLIKLGKVCEFQTAFIDEIDNIYNRINELINNLKNNGISDARHIPTMPDIIKLDSFNEKYKGISSIPVGIYKDNLTSCLYDFGKNVTNIISSDEIENIRKFIMNFLRLLEINNTFNKMIVDSNNYFENFNYSLPFESNDMNSVIDKISLLDNKIQEILKENNMNVRSLKKVPNTMIVIIDFEKFMSKLDDEHKDKFKEILNNNKDTLKINFVFVDIPFGFKKYEYEEWYKNTMNNNNGIWIGSGVTNQFALKLTIQPSSINNIDNEYAVVIKKGMPSIIKVINEIKDEE
jgi:DNA segregation ATPase FtsK/SpoIIIE and related proteins